MRRQLIPIRIKATDLSDHKRLIFHRQAVRRRQGNTSFVDAFADPKVLAYIADVLAVCVARLLMKRIKESARLNLLTGQENGKLFCPVAKERCKPKHRLAPRVSLYREKVLKFAQFLHVTIPNLALLQHNAWQFFHLCDADSCLQIREREIKSNGLVNERPFLLAAVIFKPVSRCRQFVVVRQHDTALTARDRLVAVVRQNAHLPERSDVLAIKRHTDAFASAFDYFQSMLA